jgi:hypothetical protein
VGSAWSVRTGWGLGHLLLVIAVIVVLFQFMVAVDPSDGTAVMCAVDRSGRMA